MEKSVVQSDRYETYVLSPILIYIRSVATVRFKKTEVEIFY